MTHAALEVVLQAKGLKQSFSDATGTVDVLLDASLTVKLGQSIALIGASGSGKSTLLALLAGLDSPTAGEVSLLGRTFTGVSEEARALLRRGKVGFVFQNFQLIPHLTALENVMLPLELTFPNLTYQALADKAMQWLKAVGLAAQANQRAAVLSGGEQQRVALARAFSTDPQIIFADEPTGSLDHATGAKVEALLFEQVKAKGTALVLVTHDPKLASKCDVVYHIQSGVLTQQDTQNIA